MTAFLAGIGAARKRISTVTFALCFMIAAKIRKIVLEGTKDLNERIVPAQPATRFFVRLAGDGRRRD